ncbi:uncharacterized protein LOC113351725 [Papaver somniferum]|uniref:uncharacterized protein LOC113351725 n=1 Tax=Papaver somniferum TaxID=3469 RepID=UPI000E701B1F|nr:uncharacterized protein LOC113351725 [Papaver somniferum]
MGISDPKTVKEVFELLQRDRQSTDERFVSLEEQSKTTLEQSRQFHTETSADIKALSARIEKLLRSASPPKKSSIHDSGGSSGHQYQKGKADKWFLNFQVGKHRITWYELDRGICSRFENPVEENFVGAFNKLVQINSVEEYFDQFEALKALMLANDPSIDERYFIMSFISGLKEEIRNSVHMFYPATLAQASSLARMEEQKFLLSQSRVLKPTYSSFSTSRSFYNSNFPPKTLTTSSSYTKTPPTTPKPFSPTSAKPTSPSPIIRRLIQEKMRLRHDKGLFYNCDEVYSMGHVCKGRQKLFMVQVETHSTSDADTEEDIFEEAAESPDEPEIEVSLNALTGSLTGDTIRVPGFLNNHPISVLIDTGSTTSFIDTALAQILACHIEPTAQLLVNVANGEKTVGSGMCSNLSWTMQGHQFTEDFFLLPLGGCDMILGVDWLRKLGDVVFNLSTLTVDLSYKGHNILLQGPHPYTSLFQMSSAAVSKFLCNTTHGLIGHFFSVNTTAIPPPIPPPISPLLEEFKYLLLNQLNSLLIDH